MYDDRLPGDYYHDNTPNGLWCNFSWGLFQMDPIEWNKPLEFPGLTLAEYKARGLLQKGCENLKNNKRYIETERILYLSHNL